MTDTQWPRYEVFKQDRPGDPHESVGSVHAVDAEMALQNGRDLFARRPRCHSLWVARADAITSKTAEELALNPALPDVHPSDSSAETYYVFQKQTERRGMTFTTHVGEVTAVSPADALYQAVNTLPQDEVFVWWVCPARAIHSSNAEDAESMFSPAKEKLYRMPNQYRTVFTMQKIKRESKES